MPVKKPSIVLDILMAAWIVFVAVIYYGGYLNPAIGALTGIGGLVYGVLLLLTVVIVAMVFLRRNRGDDDNAEPDSDL